MEREKRKITLNRVSIVVSGLGIIAGIIALIMLLVEGGSILPEWTVSGVATHPLFWLVFLIINFTTSCHQEVRRRKDG